MGMDEHTQRYLRLR